MDFHSLATTRLIKSFGNCLLCWVILILAIMPAFAQQKQQIPHNQSEPPGPALSPEEAVAKMTVPDGFTVEIVASEPNIVNPVSMTFDERGRVWITESLEYPRLSSGPGQDRIKILEDTDHDGKMDKFTIFAEGLNIPSGIAVGYGGVWVANSPDILFLQDTDGDDQADTQTVVVTGFGRDDTHELPNSLTWGPDGWLYGLNGVFNRSNVKDPVSGKEYAFTCALFRINPRTHEFQLFAEGTSNPWGVAWNPSGEAFVSACVIDHLWHLTETGYYHRQGGPYPPFTWKIESIVSHKHQKAAYCGIHYFDSDAYPEQYRDRLVMGNIHGSCINVDVLADAGATYHASPEKDLLSAHDAWFMPVVQKTGPDGCLWILDWYDQYHCYQDARRDPNGLDRLKGRLYRLRYKGNPHAGAMNLAAETTDQLITRLHSPSVFFRDLAQRILSERNDTSANLKLQQLALTPDASLKTRLHALWARIGAGTLPDEFLLKLLQSPEPDLRAWGIRAAGNQKTRSEKVITEIRELRNDAHPRVRLQVAVAAGKLDEVPTVSTLADVLVQAGEDPLTPRIVWQNLHPRLEDEADEFLTRLSTHEAVKLPAVVTSVLTLTMDRILATPKPDTRLIARLIRTIMTASSDTRNADPAFRVLTARIRSGELNGQSLADVKSDLAPLLIRTVSDISQPARSQPDAALVAPIELAVSLGIPSAVDQAVRLLEEAADSGPANEETEVLQSRLLNALITARDPRSLALANTVAQSSSPALQRYSVQAMGRIGSKEASASLIGLLSTLPPEVQPSAVEALTDRAESSIALLNAVAEKIVSANAINANQARKMLALNNDSLNRLLDTHWGTVRTQRDPARARLISQMRNTLRTTPGDAVAGRIVFKKVCAQCHKMYGEGAEVGPDITRNGRASFEQLLSNVFDPSLVIGASYQALTVATKEGRVVTGLPTEDNAQRVVLKIQGDKQEIIARRDIEEIVRSQLSLMPEGLEKQLQPQELADLFAYLVLDRPPEDSNARFLPGARPEAASTQDAAKFSELMTQILPGYQTSKSGQDGVALIANYHGRPALRTHPVSRSEPCSLSATIAIPEARQAILHIGVAADERGDWQLVVRANGKPRHQSLISRDGDSVVWREIEVDLSDLAGQSVTIELQNRSNDWSYEFAYWNMAEIFTTSE